MDIFVYGTLMSPRLMRATAGGQIGSPLPATLSGYDRHRVQNNVVPFIALNPKAHVNGIIWRDLTPDQHARLDVYEVAFGYTRRTVTVDGPQGPLLVSCYFPPDDIVADHAPWTLAAWEDDHLAPAILAAQELYAHDPLPAPDALRRMWPMIEARAWAKHRAQAAPATTRHAAQIPDVTLHPTSPPMGSFFRMQQMDVDHLRFDRARSGVLKREVFIAVDAALVLPYDPVRDKVLLVEQFRMGPTVRRDPNPWMLEPIAGIVDARETPEAAAHREAREEAALTLTALEPVSEFYPSPGATTDYFYTYIGLCALPMDDVYFGGIASEGEDIRLHPMGFAAAMALADSGEIQAGPLLLMLNWLARHRDRIRATA